MADIIETVEGQENTPAERTFTQAEVDTIVSKRIARVMKGMPSAEEMEEYNTYKATKAEQENTINTLTTERDNLSVQLTAANEKLQQYERDKYLAAKGLVGEEAEFIAYKANKMITDDKTFEQAVDELISNRKPNVVIKTGGTLGGGDGAKSASDTFNALIRSARK